jgi:serine/threonine-protein kinase
MTELAIGALIGSYRIVGAFGDSAYRAVHEDKPQRVVIHVAPSDGWRDTALHVLRTARILEAIAHPGIARIVDRGVLPDRRPWWASDVPSGVGLFDLIARREMPAVEVAAMIHDLADVLVYAHERGVVHRALTLRSVVLATGTRAFPLAITDWGVRDTDLGVFGAPEGEAADGRGDVYALGVIGYRAATRRFPQPDASCSDVVPGLATLLARMLVSDPAARPTAIEVRALARELLAERSGDVVAEAVAEAAEQAESSSPELLAFADEASQPNEDYDARVAFPRFAKPKWTPAPPIGSESPRAESPSELVDKPRS